MNELIINKNKEKSSIEIGVLEENNISEIYVYEGKKESIIGNIYCGIVQNVVDGMQAAFVDIGIEKNTFISIKDALPKVDVAKEELVIDKNMSEKIKILINHLSYIRTAFSFALILSKYSSSVY